MAEARRPLLRAAMFLCTIPLLTVASSTLYALCKAVVAPALSPVSIALRTRLIAVRMRERMLALCSLCTSFWRARFLADLILAMLSPDARKKRQIIRLLPCFGKGNKRATAFSVTSVPR